MDRFDGPEYAHLAEWQKTALRYDSQRDAPTTWLTAGVSRQHDNYWGGWNYWQTTKCVHRRYVRAWQRYPEGYWDVLCQDGSTPVIKLRYPDQESAEKGIAEWIINGNHPSGGERLKIE
jgi:hypothetical protein